MRRLLFLSFIISVIIGPVFSQTVLFEIQNNGKSKILKQSCKRTVFLGYEVECNQGTTDIVEWEGKLCKIEKDSFHFKALSKTVYFQNKLGEKIKTKTRFDSKDDVYKLPVQNLHYLKKYSVFSYTLKSLSAVLTVTSVPMITIINPLVSTDFKNGEIDGKKWMRLQFWGLGVLSAGITGIITIKPKTYFFGQKTADKPIWKFIDVKVYK